MPPKPYFVSLHHKISLDVNLPALAFVDERAQELISNAGGVLLPKCFSPSRYRQIAQLAANHLPRLESRFNYRGKVSQIKLFRRFGLLKG
jgi:hypothetical protein